MNNMKIQRWQVLLSKYGAKVQYRKGKNNIRADMLSRIKTSEEVATLDTADRVVENDLDVTVPAMSPPILHDHLDLQEIGREKQGIEDWSEAKEEESRYEILNHNLFSTKRPHQFAAEFSTASW